MSYVYDISKTLDLGIEQATRRAETLTVGA